MKPIGGYFEFELSSGEHYHKDAIRLNTARNCLEYILLSKKYSKVYIPYYICETMLEPLKNSKYPISFEFYRINWNLEPTELPHLGSNEALLYTNYFGLKQDCVENLASHFGDRLIVDNSQSFFDMPIKGIDTFYSARKFFGVPDGAYLYTNSILGDYYGRKLERDYSYKRIDALIKRIDLSPESGYIDFQKKEEDLSNKPIMLMSKLTESILSSIDYDSVIKKRRNNFETLQNKLYKGNSFYIKFREDAVPLCFPFLDKTGSLRQKLIKNKIFCPTFWSNVLDWSNQSWIEFQLAKNLIPLPIDQRYDKFDMKKIISHIL